MQDMIKITVRLFGPARDLVGHDTLEYSLAPPAQLGDLLEMLQAKYPVLSRSAVRFAVNEEYADAQTPLAEGDEVAVIPPVAGGAGAGGEGGNPGVQKLVILTTEPIDVGRLVRRVEHPSCGGIATFAGVVRAEGDPGNSLAALEYSAHQTMAERHMQRLREAARQQFAIHEAAIAHRIGRLEIGEVSVAVMVSAPHRASAFEACRWIIDELKRDVPIWKKEIWAHGESTWVDPSR